MADSPKDTSSDEKDSSIPETTDPEEAKAIEEMLKGMKDIKLIEEPTEEKDKTPTKEKPKSPEVEVGSEMEKLLGEAVEATVLRQDNKAKDEKDIKWLCLATLRYRNYDIKTATNRVLELLEWRRKWDIVNQKLDKTTKDFLQTGVVRLLPKPDKQGRAIMILNLRFHTKKFTAADVIRSIHWLVIQALKRDPSIQKNGIVAVNDMKGVTHNHLDLNIPKELLPAMSKKFPVRMGGIYLVHPTALLRVLIPLYQRFSPKLAKRLHIYGDNLGKLQRNFDKDVLPEDLEGTLKYDFNAWVEEQAKSLS